MKLLKWTTKAAREAKDGQFFMRLLTSRFGDITLAVVGKDGKRVNGGNVMVYDNDLRVFVLRPCVSTDLPLKTDITGSVLVYSDNEAREAVKHYQPKGEPEFIRIDGKELLAKILAEKEKIA